MTSEQFIFWLTGFLKGMKFGNEKASLATVLEEELKKVTHEKIEYEVVSTPVVSGCHLGKSN